MAAAPGLGREVEFSAVIWKEEEGFVSFCPELGVTSCGDTVEEAAQMLQEAAALYLVNARELGLMEDEIARSLPVQRWTTSIKVAV